MKGLRPGFLLIAANSFFIGMMAKRILFITTSNLATNPRLVKEIDLALAQNFSVTVLSFSFSNWSLVLNEALKGAYDGKINLVEIPAGRKPFLPWAYSSIAEKTCSLLAAAGIKHPLILSQSLQKRTVLLMAALKRLSFQPHFIVAHNPGSFYPAMTFAKKKGVPFAVDIEDYHPGEYKDVVVSERMKMLQCAVVSKTAYVSAAAPLILEEVKKDCMQALTAAVVVPNYFPAAEFVQPVAGAEGPLRLVWFSQYVAAGRGLETLLEVLPPFNGRVTLHLYGHPQETFVNTMLSQGLPVQLHGPVQQTELHQQLANYDVGLAFEDAQANLNRDICLTNKLLSYFQAGLFVLATNTSAQQQFMQEHPAHGCITSLTKAGLTAALEQLLQQKEHIRKESITRYINARKYNSQLALQPLAQLWQVKI